MAEELGTSVIEEKGTKVDPVVKTVFWFLKCETVIPFLWLTLRVIVPWSKT